MKKIKPTFLKLIASYILLTSIILLVTTVILYKGYKEQIIEQADIASQQMLSQAKYYTQHTENWAKSFIYQLYIDKDIYKLMYETNRDYSQNVLIGMMKIRQAATLVPLIHSIYIYNNVNKMFYSSLGNSADRFTFEDQGIVELLKENNQTFSSNLIPRYVDFNTNGLKYRKNLLTIILSNVKNTRNNMPDGAIIINIDADNVESYFKNSISGQNNLILAINTGGKIIFHPDPKLYLTNISNKSYIKKILKEHKTGGSFIQEISGKPSIVTFLKSPRSDLIFINITAYDTLLGTINKMVRLIIIVIILTLLIGIFFAIYLSRNIYQPINKAVNYLKDIAPMDSYRDELDYLVLAVDKILNTPSSLKDLSIEDKKMIKEKLLLGIVLDTIDDYEKLQEKIEELQLKISNSNSFIVIVFKIDNYKETGQFTNHLVEFFERDEVDYEFLQLEDSEITLIKGFTTLVSVPDIIESIRLIQNEIKQNLGITVSAGLGECVESLTEINRSYKIAKECLNYRYKYGKENILYYDKIVSELSEGYKYNSNLEQNIFNALKMGNLTKVEEELNKMLAEIKNYTYHEVLLALTQLALNSKILITNLSQMSNQSLYIDIQEFKKVIENMEDLDEAKQWFIELYKNTIEKLKEKKVNRKKDLIYNVIKYIEENYHDPQLSLEIIAEHFGISPNYLRMQFKEAENKSLSAYINELRFEKARQLLEETSLTVKEIAIKVGFENYNYFYTAFKKYYGLSPNQFRLNIEKKNK
ncbi:transcriptional regulator, AraC family [Carboxydocella thermautotrophica]|nr:transcriptional regulator, AraC family [Carboxydocella thermautotrophica]